MANDADKLNFAKQAMNFSTRLVKEYKEAVEIKKVWFQKTYGSGGGDEIIDTDIGTLPITAAELQSLMTSLLEFVDLFENAAVTQGDHFGNFADCMNVNGEEYTITLPAD